MSRLSSLHSPSSTRGYSPDSQMEYGRRWPPGITSSFRNSTKSSPVVGLPMSTVQLRVPSGPAFGSRAEINASIIGVAALPASVNAPNSLQR